MTTTLAVMDLQAQQVVHAVAGQRDRYRPLRSPLVASSEPYAVACALAQRYDLDTAYVADLDAIAGERADADSIRAIMAAGMRVILDAGIGDLQRATDVLELLGTRQELVGVVVALESCRGAEHWPELVTRIGTQRAVFSLDLRGQSACRPSAIAAFYAVGNRPTGLGCRFSAIDCAGLGKRGHRAGTQHDRVMPELARQACVAAVDIRWRRASRGRYSSIGRRRVPRRAGGVAAAQIARCTNRQLQSERLRGQRDR